MRIGNGIRIESSDTSIYFVTANYLIHLIGSRPEALRSFTHLIIDDVHERSFNSDLLCLLAKRHINKFPKLKLIIMSATLDSNLYQEYFQLNDRNRINSSNNSISQQFRKIKKIKGKIIDCISTNRLK